MTDDPTMSQISISCAALHKMQKNNSGNTDRLEQLNSLQQTLVEPLKDTLSELLALKAQAVCDEERGFEVAVDLPGYLVRQTDNINIYFPWFIIDDLPDTEILDWIASCAMKIKAARLSVICLSGSALFFGSLRSLSDIDFLEYEQNPADDEPADVRPDGYFVLKRKQRYIEYAVATPFYGIVEITNKLVEIDNSLDGPSMAPNSHPYQEAPLVHTPRELADPLNLGSYVSFLARQCISYAHNEPTKIAKRLLPLSRITEETKIADWLLNAFEGPEIEQALRVKQKIQLLKKVQKSGCDEAPDLRDKILSEIAQSRDNTDADPKFTNEEREILSALESSIKLSIIKNYKKIKSYIEL